MDRGFVLDECQVRRPLDWKDHRVKIRVDLYDQIREVCLTEGIQVDEDVRGMEYIYWTRAGRGAWHVKRAIPSSAKAA